MNNEPEEVQCDWKNNPQNCDSHVKFIEKVLNENEHDQSVSHKVEKMIFVEHNEKFQTQ